MPLHYTPKDTERFWLKVRKTGDCWLWEAGTDMGGYGHFGVNGRTYRAHRFAYALTYGVPPDDLLVCHRCDTPRCVRPDHLFLGTPADNSKDRNNKNRQAKGDHVPPERRARGFRNGRYTQPGR